MGEAPTQLAVIPRFNVHVATDNQAFISVKKRRGGALQTWRYHEAAPLSANSLLTPGILLYDYQWVLRKA
jgi:hypothetical protein